jgi:hypothetical protein
MKKAVPREVNTEMVKAQQGLQDMLAALESGDLVQAISELGSARKSIENMDKVLLRRELESTPAGRLLLAKAKEVYG